jgi:hypothetical protein
VPTTYWKFWAYAMRRTTNAAKAKRVNVTSVFGFNYSVPLMARKDE